MATNILLRFAPPRPALPAQHLHCSRGPTPLARAAGLADSLLARAAGARPASDISDCDIVTSHAIAFPSAGSGAGIVPAASSRHLSHPRLACRSRPPRLLGDEGRARSHERRAAFQPE